MKLGKLSGWFSSDFVPFADQRVEICTPL